MFDALGGQITYFPHMQNEKKKLSDQNEIFMKKFTNIKVIYRKTQKVYSKSIKKRFISQLLN